ncbi:YciI family protein [Aquibaculum sediminis]|uniref:YciI family protein n=1 Tax=Aquibaculum sediminis TaxID=3231907 RepID=UPI0034553B1F
MLFALICHDKPNQLELRMQHRPDHLAYLDAHADQLVYAGPLLDEDESAPAGSLLVLDVPDRGSAEAFASGDPYARAGLFREVRILPTRQVFPKA